MALRSLRLMYDAESGLFCHRVKSTQSGVVREGVSDRYTLITLAGLVRAKAAGLGCPMDISAILGPFLHEKKRITNLGDLGLLCWVSALVSEKHLESFLHTYDLQEAIQSYSGVDEDRTMELAWFLAGISHAAESALQLRGPLQAPATESYELLRLNQGPHGIFGHRSRWRSLGGVVRGHIGSFADQVYPIYAMVQFSRVYQIEEASQAALKCARAICRMQGPEGQWWWHYNSVSGKVVEHYPVFSVHQDGMAPMALTALQNACGTDFRGPIEKGLGWIYGANELQQDLTDESENLIWRCVGQRRFDVYRGYLSAALGRNRGIARDLQVLYECRPYHLGWLLYAFAGTQVNSGHLTVSNSNFADSMMSDDCPSVPDLR